eukprot:25751-Pyramimonas_sp.AAC.1
MGVPKGRVASGLRWTVGKILSVFPLPLSLRLATIIAFFPAAATGRRRARWKPRMLGAPSAKRSRCQWVVWDGRQGPP